VTFGRPHVKGGVLYGGSKTTVCNPSQVGKSCTLNHLVQTPTPLLIMITTVWCVLWIRRLCWPLRL